MLQVVKLKAAPTQTFFLRRKRKLPVPACVGPKVKEHVLLLAPPNTTVTHRSHDTCCKQKLLDHQIQRQSKFASARKFVG